METLSKQQKGQSIFEVIVAVALVSLILITLVGLATLSIAASTFSRNQTQASRFTQQAAEWLRAEKDSGWANFQSRAATKNWCLDALYWNKPTVCSTNDLISGTKFTRSLVFTVNADSSIQADISTSWVDAKGTHIEPTSVVFTNWK